MKKSEAVKLLQSVAFKADGYEQFVVVHIVHNTVEVSVHASRPFGPDGLGSEEELLVDVSGSTLAKAVAVLVKKPEWKQALLRAEKELKSA